MKITVWKCDHCDALFQELGDYRHHLRRYSRNRWVVRRQAEEWHRIRAEHGLFQKSSNFEDIASYISANMAGLACRYPCYDPSEFTSAIEIEDEPVFGFLQDVRNYNVHTPGWSVLVSHADNMSDLAWRLLNDGLLGFGVRISSGKGKSISTMTVCMRRGWQNLFLAERLRGNILEEILTNSDLSPLDNSIALPYSNRIIFQD